MGRGVTELYRRVLLWHKLVAQTTGGLALCSAKHRLNRDEATSWATALRNVADDIQAAVTGAAFVLDNNGRRVVDCVSERPAVQNQEAQHVASSEEGSPMGVGSGAAGRKSGGLRVANRKKQ